MLCIDDNPVSGLLVQEYFRLKLARPVRVASSGLEGLRMAWAQPPCAVLLDLSLPDLPGLQVLARLRAHPATRAVPVAIVSGSVEAEDEQQARALGAQAFWRKPLDLGALEGRFAELLADWAHARS